MNKTEQIASIRVGYVTFKIIQKNKENLDKEYLLYRCWYEPTAFGGVHHKALRHRLSALQHQAGKPLEVVGAFGDGAVRADFR